MIPLTILNECRRIASDDGKGGTGSDEDTASGEFISVYIKDLKCSRQALTISARCNSQKSGEPQSYE